MPDIVTLEVSERIATITLNRPEARNALSSEMLRLLPQRFLEADASDDVDVIVLTGTDPAFCAGLDLKELGSSGANLAVGSSGEMQRPIPDVSKPVIGAINGPAVTGGFELALACDFLVASERARFGDTHARVGVMPGWGLTVMLPQAIGVRRAREMSYTGNFITAHEALQWGLVNHVVDHIDLLPFTRRLALDIVSNDQRGVRQIRRTYAAVVSGTVAEGWRIEQRDAAAWLREGLELSEVERRREAVRQRGQAQT